MKTLVPLLLVLGACSTSSSSPDVTDGGDRVDAGSMLSTDGGGGPAVEEDARPDAPSSPVGCHNEACESATAPISAEGTTPWGRFVAQQAAVTYTGGFTNYTTITVYGTLEGKDAELVVNVEPANPDVLYVAGPGTYEDVGEADGIWASISRPISDGQCDNEELAGLKVLITEHESSTGEFEAGEPVALKGTITAQGSGWDLEIPFELSTVCAFYTSL